MTEDLSRHHAPLTNLFPAPASADGWDEYRLSGGQAAFYEEHGYLTGVRVLDAAQVEALRAELRGLTDPEHPARALWYEFNSNESADPARVLFHALGAWRIAQGFHDLLWNPRFTVPASQLLGGAVRFWHDQLFCKPARHGVVAWHQDYSYWTRTTPLAHLTCWVGLPRRRALRLRRPAPRGRPRHPEGRADGRALLPAALRPRPPRRRRQLKRLGPREPFARPRAP